MIENNPFLINEKAFLNTSSQSNAGEVASVLPTPIPVEDDEVEDENDKSYGSLKVKMPDSYNPFKAIDPVAWLSSPESRSLEVDKSITRMRDGLMADGAMVPSLLNGEIEQVPASLAGRLTPAGAHAFDNAMQILSMAEQDKEGGYRVNQMTKQNKPAFGSAMMTAFDAEESHNSKIENTKDVAIGDKTYKVKTITPDQVGSEKHVRAILNNYKLYSGDDPLKSDYFNIDSLINWRDSINRNGMPVTPWNADSVTQILDTKDVKIDDKIKSEMSSVFDRLKAEANMPEEKLVDMYKGQPIFNYAEIKDLNELELQFSNLKMPKADKARLLASFRTNFESSAGELMSQAVEGGKTWDYMMNFIPNVALANLAGADIGFNNEDKLLQGISEGRSYYDMVKSGTIDVDRNWLHRAVEKTAISTLASFQNTGTGGGFLIAKGLGNVVGLVSEDAEKAFDRGAGYMAEAASITQDAKRQYYKNIGSSEIKMGSITISSDDIYDLAGNILETISTGGISSAAKLGAKGLSTAATRTATMGVARNIGKESAKKIAQEAVEAGIKRGAFKNSVTALKEQAKSLWLNSSTVGKAESILATSLHGSFTSAGGALSEGMSKGLDEAAMKGLSGNEATEYAANKAVGYGLVNGVATFVMMTAMNAISPGIEKILISPEDGLSLISAIRNSAVSKATRKSISGLLKEVVTDKSMRKTIVKGIANEIGDMVTKNGVAKFMGGVTAGTASEFIEEAGDTALALAGEAYLLQDKDTRKLLEKGGYWTEVVKAGVLGAFGGIASGTFQTTSEGNKKSIKATMDAMEAYKQTLPDNIKAKMGASISVKSDTSESGRRIDTIKNILAAGSVVEKVDALANIGQSVALDIVPADTSTPQILETPTTTTSTEASAPTTVDTKPIERDATKPEQMTPAEYLASYRAERPDDTATDEVILRRQIESINAAGSGTRASGEGKVPFNAEAAETLGFKIPEGYVKQGELYVYAPKEVKSPITSGSEEKPKSPTQKLDYKKDSASEPSGPVIPILIKNTTGINITVNAPTSPENLAKYAHAQAHGTNADVSKLTANSKKTNVVAGKNEIPITTYTADGKKADIHSFTAPNGETIFSSRNGLISKIKKAFDVEKVDATGITKIDDKNDIVPTSILVSKAPLFSGEAPSPKTPMPRVPVAPTLSVPTPLNSKTPSSNQDQKEETTNKTKTTETTSDETVTVLQSSILERTNSSSQEVLGDEKIPEGAVKNYYNKIKTALQRLNTSIIFVNNLSELSEHGFTPEEIAENEGNPAFTAPMGGSRNKDFIVIDLSQIKNAEDLDTAIKHEHFHTFQLAYNRTPAGKLLTEKAAKEVASNVAVEAFMEKEYYSYSSLSIANKFYEFTRAFVSGKINGQTMGKMGLPNTLEWLKQFLSFSKKQIKRNPDMTTYFNGLEAEYLKAVKANKELFNYKAGATESFKNWVQGILSSPKVKKPKVKGRIISTRSANEEEMNSLIAEIRSAIRESITGEEQIDASDILSFIKNEVENHKLDLDVGLSPLSKASAYRAIVQDWSDNELIGAIKEDLEAAAQSLLVHNEPMLGEPASVQMSAQVKEKIDYSQYTNITKFIREDKVLPVETPKKIIAAASDADRQFSNAQVKGEIDAKSGLAVSIGLNRGDIVEVQGLGTGDVKNLLIFSHTEIVTDSNGEKTVLHRFLKASSMMNGKVTNFGKTVQSNMSEKFVRDFKDSDLAKTLLTANDGQIKISNPIDLLRFVFDSLVSNSTLIEGGKPAKFDDLFNLVAGSPAGATSPFSYTNRKITVDVLKLQQDFAKIDSNLLENPDTAETITLLIAQTVRTAVEEELLHHVTTSVFTNQELVDFYDDLAGLPQFNILRGQIMAQQGIKNPQDALTELDKIVISTEFLSFIHQKSLDGATYGDQYAQLMDIATSFATSDTARAVATSYGKRFKDILGARAASAYMSPRMIDMLKKLTSVKVEAGMRRDGTGYESLYAQYNAERYNEARSRFQSSIDQAFIQQSASVNDLRTFLRDSSINERQILDFDTEKEIVSLTPSFRKFYAEKIGDEAMKELDDYFSRLNSSNAVGGLIDSVRAARSRMDALLVDEVLFANLPEEQLLARNLERQRAVDDYNSLIVDYAEIVLNKNLNEVDEFGRTFDVVGTEIGIRVKDNDLTFVQDQGLLTENTVPNIQSALFAYEPNVFGYQNQSPDYAITARGAKRNILEKTDIDIAKNDQSFVFGYIGRYTSDDRKNFTDKVLRIESNAAFLGESEYNSLVLARINGEQITIGSLNQTYSDFSRTMGFNPIQVKQSPNGDVTPTALNNYLNKMVIPDTAITIAGADGESSTIRKMSSSGRIKNAQFPLRGESALTQAVNILFKESAIDSWIGGLEDLIGYDPTTGATSVVNEIAGKQSFASKFAQQVAYRIYGGGLIVGSGVKEKLVGADGDTLYGFIREYRNAYYSFNSGLTKPEGVITKSFSPAEIADLIQRLPTFLEAIDALNQDIGLARKAYSRFTSKYVSNTILGDIRLIQEQGADGIRANEELLKAIKNSYHDIQGMDNVEFEINQINQGGQIGIKGMSALELMNSLVTIPESAQNEYHVVNLQSEKAKQLADYYSTFEEVGLSLRGKDADGKTGFALDNLIFNVVQRIGDRPDETDVNFNEDRDIKASQADEATSEALDAYRRKQLHEEVKRLKSWTNQAGLSIFQSVAGPLGQQRLSGLNPMLAKRFFSLFAKATNEEYNGRKIGNTSYTAELNNLVRDQMIALGSHYKIGNEVDPRFLKIASNVMSYGHPLPLLMDVIEIIAEKERSFLAELNAASELLGDVALAGLEKEAKLSQGEITSTTAELATEQQKSENQLTRDQLELKLKFLNESLEDEKNSPDSMMIKVYEKAISDTEAELASIDKPIVTPMVISQVTNTASQSTINQRAAENILGSLREDIEKGQLITGTLFKANTFKFKSDESMASNDLLLNSPLFSALIQAMPNLLIYQPNDQYEGKNTRVPNDIEFAQFGDGEGILYIGNAYAMPASKQAEILERLFIAQIRRESVNGTQASVLQQVISDAAKVVREQANYALNLTPERIESMVGRASSAITSVTKLDDDAKKMLIDKYRDSLQAQALQSISLLGSHNSRNKYVQDELGMKSEMVSDFFAKLVNQDGETGVQSVLSDIQLIIGMLTNPDAYRLLNNLKAPEVTFEAKSLDSKYNSMLERALGVLGRPEIPGSEWQRIALEKINQQDTGDNEIDFEIPVFAEDILASIEENFLSEQEKPTRKISLKDIKRNIKRLSPDFTRNVINELILKDMSETSRMFGTQAELKDALVQTIDQTNFLYRYVASNLINALNNSENLVQQTIEDMSMPSAGMSVFEQLKSVPTSNANQALKDRAFPVLMDSIGNPNVSARGNLTDYYYNNSPTTEVFSMRRKNHFAGLLVGKTPAMQYVLNQLFETTSQGKDFDKINRMEYAIDLENENYPNLLGLVQEQLADLIGRDLLNEAIGNVDRNIENAENSKRDARIRKAELEKALDEARATGTSAMLEAAASRSRELIGESDELLLQMSDKVGDAIYALKKNAAKNSHLIHKVISRSHFEQKERLVLVNKIATIDKQISTALADENTSESALNQQLQTLVSKRNALAKNANLELTNFIVNIRQAVISIPGFKSLRFEDTKSILGRQLGTNISNMINIQFLDVSTLGEQGISVAEYLQLNRDRMITDAKRKEISGKIKEIQTFEFSNNIAISAQSNQVIVEYAKQLIDEQINKYKKTPDVATLFSRLNKGNQIEKAVNALMKDSAIQEATTLQRTKALVMQALTQNPSLQKTIAEEVAFDSIENVVESGIETGGRDAFGNVIENMSTEIEMLADEIDRLQAILNAPDADFLSENKKLFKIQHSIPFEEQEALKRMSNGNSPVFKMDLILSVDQLSPNASIEAQEERQSLLNRIRNINEAIRLFVERDGSLMYRTLTEEVEIYGEGFDVRQNIDNAIKLAELKNSLDRNDQRKFDKLSSEASRVDEMFNNTDPLAIELFGISLRDMEALGLEPVVADLPDDQEETDEQKAQRQLKVTKKYKNDRERLMGTALFIKDQHGISVYSPTEGKLGSTESKTYLVMNRNARQELQRFKQATKATWSVNEALKDVVFRAAKNVSIEQGLLRTQAGEDIDINLNEPISKELANATGVDPATTIKEFQKIAKERFNSFFLKQQLNKEIGEFAKGIGIIGTIKPIEKLDDAEISAIFDDVLAFASNPANAKTLQNAGFGFAPKTSVTYTSEQKKTIVADAIKSVVKENKFLDPSNNLTAALIANEALLEDVISMLHTSKLKNQEIDGIYDNHVLEGIKSIASLFVNADKVAEATSRKGYSVNTAIRNLDLHQNYTRLYSVLYGESTLKDLIAGVQNPKQSQNTWNEMTVHENAEIRQKFGKSYGSYQKALRMLGILDHGISGASGRNQYAAKYQEFQDRVGKASKSIGTSYSKGAKAYLVASLRGILVANEQDGGDKEKVGIKLYQWATAFDRGMSHHNQLLKNRNKKRESLGFVKKGLESANSGVRKQLREDNDVAEINKLIESEIKQITYYTNLSNITPEIAETFINQIEQKLLNGYTSEEISEINNYSSVLLQEFEDISNAHRIANTFASEAPHRNIDDWMNRESEDVSSALKRSYSIMPLRFGYSKNPLDTNDDKGESEAVPISDFTSFEKSLMNYKGSTLRESIDDREGKTKIFRPIDLNPFTAPDQLASDALYRTAVTPSYMILKKLLGAVTDDGTGAQKITKHGHLNQAIARDAAILSESKAGNYPYIAAYLMGTIEKTIRNDMPKNLYDNYAADILRASTTAIFVKTLLSVWQPILNGIVPAIGKMATVSMLNNRGVINKSPRILAECYWMAFKGYFGRDSELVKFTKENSINSYKWKAEGSQTRDTQISETKYGGQSNLLYWSRKFLAKTRNIGEKALDFTIGQPERAMVQSIFAFELFHQLKDEMGEDRAPKTIAEMLSMNPDEISTLAKTRADIMVTDFMGLGDRAKKAGLFNIETRSATIGLLLAGATRYGNHSMTVGANMMVNGQQIWNSKISKKDGWNDPEMVDLAIENAVGTVVQNTLFFLARAQIAVPTILWIASLAVSALGGDDEEKEEETSERTIRWLRKLQTSDELESDGLMSRAGRFAREQILPGEFNVTKKEFIKKSGGYDDALRVNLYTGVRDSMLDLISGLPGVGATLAVPIVGDQVKSVITNTAKAAAPKDAKWMDIMVDRSNGVFDPVTQPIVSPIESGRNFSGIFLNRFAPKDGRKGTDNADFIEGIYNSTIGTREGIRTYYKRAEKKGGWGAYGPPS